MSVCCFTGSRPQNLLWGNNENDPRCQNLLSRLEAEIIKAVDNDYRHFISGMAIGIDTYAARIVLKLREQNLVQGITLEAAIPCPNQDKLWSEAQKKEYANLLQKCDKHTLISQNFSNYCFQKRNEYMVDVSALVIAVTDGRAGGTMNTVNYAKEKNKTVIVLTP